MLVRNDATGRIYFLTLDFVTGNTIPVFHSDDNGVTWSAPVNGTPGGSIEDKPWAVVDNFSGPGQGNVYLLSRRFGSGGGIYFFKSTDNGATFGPNGGVLIVSGQQGAYIAVGTDHSIYAFYWTSTALRVRRSTDFGATFGPAITVATLVAGGINGDLGLTGIRQGLATPASFRSSKFPHAAVNPVNGDIYVTYANDVAGADKADVFYVQSTDDGATWSAPVKINDDATTTDQWMPTVAVSPDGLKVGFFYYSRQEDAANNLFKYYARTGTVSGSVITLGQSFPVSTVASLPEFGRDNVVNTTYMGDYNTVSATNTHFHIVWSDNRDDLPGGAPRKDPNVYYAKILTPEIDNEPPSITCPSNINQSNDAGLCSKLVNVVFPIASDNSGSVNITGVRSDNLALNAPYPVGTTTIVWTAEDPSNNTASCTQTVVINDNELPNAICKNAIITLVNGAASITVADINNNSTDNCGIQSIVASKTDFTCADIGDNTVVLTVTDIYGNTNTCNATVTVQGEVPTCTITSVPENNIYTGGVATNIYLGYGPQSTTLQVSAPLSGAPYTYSWTGDGVLSNYNTANPVFTPTAEGSYNFTVEVTNKYGCKNTCSITINVYDIRVPGSKGKKVYLCHAPDGNPANKQTLAISVSAVPGHLLSHSNDRLGKCDLEVATTFRDDIMSNNLTGVIKVAALPNPNRGNFELQLSNFKEGRLDIRIFNYNGKEVNRKTVMANGTTQLVNFNLRSLASGVYFVKISGKEGVYTEKFVIKR